MDPTVWAEMDELRNLKTADLRAKYREANRTCRARLAFGFQDFFAS